MTGCRLATGSSLERAFSGVPLLLSARGALLERHTAYRLRLCGLSNDEIVSAEFTLAACCYVQQQSGIEDAVIVVAWLVRKIELRR